MTDDRVWRRRSVAAAIGTALAVLPAAGTPAVLGSAAAGTTASAASSSASAPLLLRGSRGPAVVAWQRDLRAWAQRAGAGALSVDGIFGPVTAARTRQFQREAGVAVDGIVGPRTRRAMASALAAGPSFEGTVGIDTAEPSGEPMALTGARFGVHEDFDRVVLDLVGDGEVGWRVLYVDEPVREQGSGHVIPLEGDAWLQISARGMGYPRQTGVPPYDGPERIPAPGAGVVEDVHVGTLYEGIQNVVLGLSSPEPFRVFRLDSPPRLVVDVRHP